MSLTTGKSGQIEHLRIFFGEPSKNPVELPSLPGASFPIMMPLDFPFVVTNRQLFQVIGLVLIALFAVANLPWTLDDYDQAKQAFTSYQMLQQRRWLFQTTPTEGLPALGERHSQFHISSKPPAVGW